MKTQCGDRDTCPDKPGVRGIGLQSGLLWRCPRCGRLWRVLWEQSMVWPRGLWCWWPAPWYVRWAIRAGWDRWPWADEVGVL